ncbi:GNAT family N-acetyltransferase [Bacillus sp. MUM 116]|uniref:GNAT family N-acetyltransferase n=1 Tax=Bacillus sp. MUM 116 TaxID=1678002 RepID=UPI0008F5DD1B|nr:GNAT family N-acetyltransferase [Bacillus sp. MUM 116]OIK16303.1 GNAT family N-acetyltransferase [Bacillus sp. MUM 116]
MNSTVEVKQLTTIEELEQVQQMEKSVWKDQAIPIHQTLTAVKNGGIVVGAYHQNQLVGFSYGFPGFINGKPYLCSHMLGIEENFRGQGIGEFLKKAQKNAAIEKGYDLLTWTYDPLESVNAFLNLTKLKAICSTYVKNCYGDMKDGLNQGLPSDRFQVEWWISNPYIEEAHQDELSAIDRVPYLQTTNGLPQLAEVDPSSFFSRLALLVPVPKQFQQVKKDAPELALDWRLKTRELFEALFENGFAAVRIVKTGDEPVVYYLLKKRDLLPVERRPFK